MTIRVTNFKQIKSDQTDELDILGLSYPEWIQEIKAFESVKKAGFVEMAPLDLESRKIVSTFIGNRCQVDIEYIPTIPSLQLIVSEYDSTPEGFSRKTQSMFMSAILSNLPVFVTSDSFILSGCVKGSEPFFA